MDAIVEPGTAASPVWTTRLACALVGHRLATAPVWNGGHGFARCSRCHRAIVRTIVHGWRLPPKGYRIRWPEAEPRDPRANAVAPVATAQPTTPPPPSPPRLPQKRSARSDDFMQDDGGAQATGLDFDDFGVPPGPAPTTARRRLPR